MSTQSPLFSAGGNGPQATATTPQRHKPHLVHRSPDSFATKSPSSDQLVQQQKQLLAQAKSNWDLWCQNQQTNVLTSNDIKQVLAKCNFTDTDIQQMIHSIDPNNTNNTIDYDTFISATVKKLSLTLSHIQHPQDLLSEFEESLRSSKRDTRYVNSLNAVPDDTFKLAEKQ